jgi:hypothetical protein
MMLNTLKPKLVKIIYTNPARTSKKTPHFAVTNVNWKILFREITTVYSENHTKPTRTLRGEIPDVLIIKAGGKNSYH